MSITHCAKTLDSLVLADENRQISKYLLCNSQMKTCTFFYFFLGFGVAFKV